MWSEMLDSKSFWKNCYMTTDEIVPILEGLDEYNMTEVGFQDTANALTPIPLIGCAFDQWAFTWKQFSVSPSYSAWNKDWRL